MIPDLPTPESITLSEFEIILTALIKPVPSFDFSLTRASISMSIVFIPSIIISLSVMSVILFLDFTFSPFVKEVLEGFSS